MRYQITVKQYKGSVPVKKECWELMKDFEKQWKNMQEFPMRVRCIREEEGRRLSFFIQAEMIEALDEPVSLALDTIKEEWERTEYVFFPAAVYNGNCLESVRLPYPPYHGGRTEEGWQQVITDIPHIDRNNEESGIQLRSGDMSTPAMGYYSEKRQEGMLFLAKHRIHGEYTGFCVREKGDEAWFSVSLPAVREKNKYFFGELPDGTGFFPTMEYPSDDEGILLKKGERLEMEIQIFRIQAENIQKYMEGFNEVRENLETGTEFCSIPFSKAYHAVKEKYKKMNFAEEGYYRVGTENEVPPCFWQAGWVGGGMNTLSFLVEDQDLAGQQARSTLRFIVEKLQRENGWYIPMYAKGIAYGDDFRDGERSVLLVRKDADLLYFLLKQAFILREKQETIEGLSESIRRQADAFVRFVQKNGQLGQFIDMEKEEILAGDTASAAIAPAALALAYEYFGDTAYLETAEMLADQYLECLHKGILNGGPGEICQASDSESAFAFLEACVQLFETTGNVKWLQAAEEAFELAITWVMSYDFSMPEESTAAKLGVHTRGTVFANAQNKHSAPGICTLSGNSMLKLYRFTGKEKYLVWLRRISHALPQFVSLMDRPVQTLAGRPLPLGYFNERVQTSDWEGKETIGEFLYGSNWPEVTMLLTYVEIPGIYINMENEQIYCMDHVKAEWAGENGGNIVIKIFNPTEYDAEVTVMRDNCREKKLGKAYFAQMELVKIPAGTEVIYKVRKGEEVR